MRGIENALMSAFFGPNPGDVCVEYFASRNVAVRHLLNPFHGVVAVAQGVNRCF